MKRNDIDECKWYDLYYKHFDPYECWHNGCYNVDEDVLYDENQQIIDDQLFCCANGDDECLMYEKWLQKENESKRS